MFIPIWLFVCVSCAVTQPSVICKTLKRKHSSPLHRWLSRMGPARGYFHKHTHPHTNSLAQTHTHNDTYIHTNTARSRTIGMSQTAVGRDWLAYQGKLMCNNAGILFLWITASYYYNYKQRQTHTHTHTHTQTHTQTHCRSKTWVINLLCASSLASLLSI